MKLKKLILILSFLGIIATCIAVSVSSAPNPQVSPLAQSFVLAVNLDTATQIRSYSIKMSFDPSVLSFSTATKGSLLNGMPTNHWQIFTESPGVIRIECIIFGAGLYVTGPGNLINLSFNSIAEGYSALDFISPILYNPNGYVIPEVSSTPGNIIIGSNVSYAKAKCFLQGAYNNGIMRTDINSILPLTSPYSANPITADSIPSDVVDWVLMELRTTPAGPPVLSRSLWLGSDGSLRTPGLSIIALTNTPPGPYYLVLRHRNHLAIMSAQPVLFTTGGIPAMLDLSQPANLYGQGGSIEVAAGIVAMIAGDASQNGAVDPADRNAHWRLQSGSSGYLSADFNLNGEVSPSDLNQFWRPNAGRSSQVPQAQ